MHDSQVIGLRYPHTDETLLCSILGRMRSVFALLVYRHDAGHRWLLNTILHEGRSGGLEADDTAYEQDLVKAEFVPRSALDKEDRAVLAACDYGPPRQRGMKWPQFRSLVPGGFPWHLAQEEAEKLLFALPRAAAVARLAGDQPEVWADHRDGEVAFLPRNFDPARDELTPRQLEWFPMIPPPEPTPEAVLLDDPARARLREFPVAKGFYLELDVTYAPFPIGGTERPYFPKLALAVDRASGFVGGFHLSDLKDNDGAVGLGTVLQHALTQAAHRPEAIHVQRPRVAAMLSQAAEALGIPLKSQADLEALNAARADLTRRFS
jgi:hypothetical protein